jgi:hypothetical protein
MINQVSTRINVLKKFENKNVFIDLLFYHFSLNLKKILFSNIIIVDVHR